MPEFTPDLLDLLARQDGVVTRAQLLEHGVSYPAVRWNAGRAWRVVLPQVFGIFREQPTTRQRQIATLLWAGPKSVLSGATAARLHGVTSADPRERIHVLVPAPQRSRSSGFAEVRRTLIPDVAAITKGPLRLSSPARAVVDAARVARGADTRSAILIEGVQRGITTVDDLHQWVLRLRPRRRAAARAALGHGLRCLVRPRVRAARPRRHLERASGTLGEPHADRACRSPAHHSRRLVRRRRPSGHGALASPPQRGRSVGRNRREGRRPSRGASDPTTPPSGRRWLARRVLSAQPGNHMATAPATTQDSLSSRRVLRGRRRSGRGQLE